MPEDWYYEAILKANKIGIVNGRSASLFDPLGTATRVEAVSMLSRFLEKECGRDPPGDDVLTGIVQDFNDLATAVLNGGDRDRLGSFLAGEAELALKSGGIGLWESVDPDSTVEVTHPEGAPPKLLHVDKYDKIVEVY